MLTWFGDKNLNDLKVNIFVIICRGYLSPEYASYGQVTEKVDVFSFGVLVLEIVSGRKNIDLLLPLEQRYIMEWVRFKLHLLRNVQEAVKVHK